MGSLIVYDIQCPSYRQLFKLMHDFDRFLELAALLMGNTIKGRFELCPWEEKKSEM